MSTLKLIRDKLFRGNRKTVIFLVSMTFPQHLVSNFHVEVYFVSRRTDGKYQASKTTVLSLMKCGHNRN